MNQITPFIFKDKNIRAVKIDDKPYFVGKDVAECLGYVRTRDAIKDHAKGAVKYRLGSVGVDSSWVYVIPESDVYRLTMRSNAPHAEKFQTWLCEVVIPQIRKTGSFQSKIPSRSELAMMVLKAEEENGNLKECVDLIKPLHEYGSIAKNGEPRTGLRRASFVAKAVRALESAKLQTKIAELQLELAIIQ